MMLPRALGRRQAGRALQALQGLSPLGTSGPLVAFNPLGSSGPLAAFRPLGSSGPLEALSPIGTSGPLVAAPVRSCHTDPDTDPWQPDEPPGGVQPPLEGLDDPVQPRSEIGAGHFYQAMNAEFGPVILSKARDGGRGRGGETLQQVLERAPRHSSAPNTESGPPPACACDQPKAVRVTMKDGPNYGREFYCCPQPMHEQCDGQFQWVDEAAAPACACGRLKVRRTVAKAGPNLGRQFYTCPAPYVPACEGVFEWATDYDDGPPPRCNCDRPKVRRTVKKNGSNQGREFWACPNPQAQNCEDAFEWIEVTAETAEQEGEQQGDKDLSRLLLPTCHLLNESRPSLTEWPDWSSDILRFPHLRSAGLPSVTRILQETMSDHSKMVLARWKAKMVRELGVEGFKEWQKLTFERGHTMHSMIETYLESGGLPDVSDLKDSVSKLHLLSFSAVQDQFTAPAALESAVVHQELGYCGIVDCVARMGDSLVLIDWKTAEKEKNSVSDLYDNPVQLAAYMGAINQDPRYAALGGNLSGAAICVVHNSGLPAITHSFGPEQMQGYWDQWIERLEAYHRNH